MEFSLDKGQGTYKIESYDDNGIKINGKFYTESLIIMPEKMIVPWGPNTSEDLKPEHFQMLIPLAPQVILLGLGLGNTVKFPNPKLYSCLTERSIGVEVMTNSAACRTYTVLMSEGRSVLAAFILK